MNLEVIRGKVKDLFLEDHTFVFNGSRGQVEKFNGQVIELYPRIFIILTEKGIIKSFSYSDFAINHLKVY